MLHNPADLSDLENNIAIFFHHLHSRTRVYPQDIGATITLVSDGTANTFGSWTQIVPINTIDFAYMVTGVVIENVDAASTYFIQLGFSIVNGSDPTTTQIMGERRVKITEVPIAQANQILDFYSMECPANAKLWGRLKTDGGATDEAYISIGVIRHIAISNPKDHLTTWPWST